MLRVESLYKAYGDKAVLENVSFEAQKGEIVGFLGANGAGKSTTMNIITGYTSCDSGKVEIEGHDLFETPQKAKACLGYLPEHPPLYPGMTVREYLEFACRLKKLKPAEGMPAHLTAVCHSLGLEAVQGRVIGHLSKGYRQRVGFAQALLGYPPLLILDEPTVGLDPKQIAEVRQLIRELGTRHTVILSSHILSEIQAVCSRVLILHAGHIVTDFAQKPGEPNAEEMLVLRAEAPLPQVEKLLAGMMGVRLVPPAARQGENIFEHRLAVEGGDAVRKALFYRFAKAEVPILELRAHRESLEELFLRLTQREQQEVADGGDS